MRKEAEALLSAKPVKKEKEDEEVDDWLGAKEKLMQPFINIEETRELHK